jgi:hypothetical protein
MSPAVTEDEVTAALALAKAANDTLTLEAADIMIAWRDGLVHVVELCHGQANKIWFILRKFVFTSSTALACLRQCLPVLSEHAACQAWAEEITSYLDLEQDVDAKQGHADDDDDQDDHDKKADGKQPMSMREARDLVEGLFVEPGEVDGKQVKEEEVKGKKNAELKQIIAALDLLLPLAAAPKQKYTKINQQGNKETLQQKVISNVPRWRQHLSKNIDRVNAATQATSTVTPASVDQEIVRGFMRTWFMKAVNASERPALAQGSANEAKIRAALAETLAPVGLSIIHTKEFGLLVDKERPHMACSVDGVAIAYDNKNHSLLTILLEYKTATTAATVRAAQKVRAELLSRITVRDRRGIAHTS